MRSTRARSQDWFYNKSFDIVGTMDTPGEPTRAQYQAMLQNLPADRFGLRFHHEKRELPVYAVTIVKGGPKIKAAGPDKAQRRRHAQRAGPEDQCDQRVVEGLCRAHAAFCRQAGGRPDRACGKYDFSLHYTIDETCTADPNAPAGLFTAIQEQLGLKLVAVKAPADVFVGELYT